jgi:hypothetical protein
MSLAQDAAFAETLALAVPFRVLEVRRMPAYRRRQLSEQAAGVVGHQGDTLMFGSVHAFGHGTAQRIAHETGLHSRRKDPDGGPFDPGCKVCTGGQPQYSPGEVFNELVTGLACAALLPGGVSFAGLHWCTAPHPGCPVLAARDGGAA